MKFTLQPFTIYNENKNVIIKNFKHRNLIKTMVANKKRGRGVENIISKVWVTK